MKTSPSSKRQAGYVSFLMVLSTGAVLSLLTIYAYRSAMASHAVTSQVQLRVDYSEKNEAILRAIVAITPNRAIRAMQSGSNVMGVREALSWQSIFTESLVLANAGTSISSNLQSSLGVANLQIANSGDSTLSSPSKIFAAIPSDTGYVSTGINRSLDTGYPVPLSSNDFTTSTRDAIYPIISGLKQYGTLAQTGLNSKTLNGDGTVTYGLPVGTYPAFNRLKYPNINFGYAKPGDAFVAKRNWWAFSVDVAGNDSEKTYLARSKRNFVFSIYEIPSQLAISASSFMSLGEFGKDGSGGAWQNVSIEGGIFAGKAEVRGNTAINALSSRRGMTLSSGTTVGGQSFTKSPSPFTPGVRESYQVTSGAFFPVSLASESGRSAFIPINRGAEFFDRFSQTAESNALSTTSWNNYSIGALQCAMRLDITGVVSATDMTPTMLRFTYYQTNGTRASVNMPLTAAVQTTLPAGYVKVCDENQSFTFATPVDVAYGVSGGFTFINNITGTVRFANNDALIPGPFADPKVGAWKYGYWRPRGPSEIKTLASGQKCIAVYPERIPALLTSMGAAGPAINNSLVVNVDYSTTGLNNSAKYKPGIPCRFDKDFPVDAYRSDYGVILRECGNLAPFTKGFSLVTNLRLYIGDDFNTTAITAPSGYTPPVTAANPTGSYFPPCSLFSPEKRYGVDVNPFAVDLRGQIGSLASDTVSTAVRPLDSNQSDGTALKASQITVNLSPITHPAQLPPITMMNWLVVLEERRKEFVGY